MRIFDKIHFLGSLILLVWTTFQAVETTVIGSKPVGYAMVWALWALALAVFLDGFRIRRLARS